MGPDSPAGWGFAAYTSTSPFEEHLVVTDDWSISYGMVKTTPLDVNGIVPLHDSNNTGAVRAIIELFDYVLYYSLLPSGSEVRVFIDSEYVIRSLLGDQLPSTHHQLVELAQQYFPALRTTHSVQLVKVSSHIGIPGKRGLHLWIPRSFLLPTRSISFSTRNRLQF